MHARLALAAAFVLILGACGSTPRTDYFLLSAEAGGSAEHSDIAIGIAELRIAEYLHRPELMTLAGSNRLVLDPYRRWAEPLDEGIRRVLVLNLGKLTGSESVRDMPWPRDWTPRWLLRVAIERLDADELGVQLFARWSLQDGERAQPAREFGSSLGRPRSGVSAESIAADMSQLLAELSARIVRAMDEQGDEQVGAP